MIRSFAFTYTIERIKRDVVNCRVINNFCKAKYVNNFFSVFVVIKIVFEFRKVLKILRLLSTFRNLEKQLLAAEELKRDENFDENFGENFDD